jgi:DNA invertase Pin-like site-specific DNA recombinase
MTEKIAYSYIRFSNESQKKGNSYDRQATMRDDWIENNSSYTLSEKNYKDLGVSGYSGVHKDKGFLGKFLALCEDGVVEAGSVLLVESIDRLGRLKGRDMLDLVSTLTNYVSIITLEDNTTYNTESFDNHQAYSLIGKIQQAHNYSKQLSHRLLKARKATRDAVLSGTKNKISKICPNWLRWDEKLQQFTEIPERVEIVKKIFNYYVIDGLGTTAIANRLNKECIKSFNDKGWHGSYIAKTLFDKKVIGEIRLEQRANSGAVIENYYPSIIPFSTYNKAQIIKAGKSKNFKTRKESVNIPFDIYGKIIFCVCGKPARLYNKGSNYYIYQCTNRKSGICNSSKALNKTDLTTHFGDYLDYKFIKWGVEAIKSENIQELESNPPKLDDLEQEIVLLRKKLTKQREQQPLAIDEIELKEINDEIEKTRDQVRSKKDKIENIEKEEDLNKSILLVEMADIGNYNVDWTSYLRDDKHRILTEIQCVNLQNLLVKSNVKIELRKDGAILINPIGETLLSITKAYKSSKAVSSRFSDGSLYIQIDKNDCLTFGEKHKRIELMTLDETTRVMQPIHPPLYFELK